MTQVTYAEAVKLIEDVFRDGPTASVKELSDALAVLRRAELVMEAVEEADIENTIEDLGPGDLWKSTDSILRAALAFKETK